MIATKGGLERPGPRRWTANGRPEHLVSACEGSLRRLRLEQIPLYQFHRPDPAVPLEDSVGALVELKDQGKIRHIGLSNVTAEQLRQAQQLTPIVSIQNRYNLTDRGSESLVDLCAEEHIAFLPWAPIQGFDDVAIVDEIAARHQVTPWQVALAWLLARSPAMLVIPGTGSRSHLEDNVAAAGVELSAEEVASLNAVGDPRLASGSIEVSSNQRPGDIVAEVGAAALDATAIEKSFGASRVLRDVSVRIAPGEVHALLGENGAGKSTLIRIIAGALQPDSGTVTVGEAIGPFSSPHDAERNGVATQHQELAVVPGLSVAENVMLGHGTPQRCGFVRWAALHRRVAEIFDRLGVELDVRRDAATLSPVERTMTLLARALSIEARLLVLDEPTASLTDLERSKLFAAIRRAVALDVGVLYVSHRLDEVFEIADTYTVLRNGAVVASGRIADTTRERRRHGDDGSQHRLRLPCPPDTKRDADAQRAQRRRPANPRREPGRGRGRDRRDRRPGRVGA